MIEFTLGNRTPAMCAPHAHRPADRAALEAEMARPSLYDAALARLADAGLTVPDHVLHRDLSRPHAGDTEVEAAWEAVYRAPTAHWELYELAEKRGTGGTSGVGYLRRMLEVVLFPELWAVRTRL